MFESRRVLLGTTNKHEYLIFLKFEWTQIVLRVVTDLELHLSTSSVAFVTKQTIT